MRKLVLLSTLAASVAFGSAASASAAPIWNLDVHHHQTHFAPGGEGEYWFEVRNVGDTATGGTVTLTMDLPAGVTRNAVRQSSDPIYETSAGAPSTLKWACPGAPGDTTVVCTTTHPVYRHSASRGLILMVDVEAGIEGDRFASATVSGGGAAKAAKAFELTQIDSEPAGFGIVAESFLPDFTQADGLTSVRESGAHPDLFIVPFDFNSIDDPVGKPGDLQFNPFQKHESENVRNINVDLPPGFLGDPTAVAECSQAEFLLNDCALATQVGRLDLVLAPIGTIGPGQSFAAATSGVFNLAHPKGSITDFGVSILGNPVHIKTSLNAANGYAISSSVPDITEAYPPFQSRATFWGIPADQSHDSERCFEFSVLPGGYTDKECSSNTPRKPFLTTPSQCNVDHKMLLHSYDSWQKTGAYGSDIEYTLPGQSTDCDRPRFEPEVELEPTGKQANTPTGLDVHIQVSQNSNPNALATPPVKSTVVTLPEGMTFSPSFADGLRSCTPAQIGLFTNDPVECPPASRIGEVELSTPLLPERAKGSMYLAAQGDNPFHSTFALYLEIHDTEERGILIKVPGRIDVDSVTGQITTVFDDLPQFPFDDLTLKFRSGPRAPLVSPPACGTHTIGVKVASYAQPTNPVDVSNAYQVAEGPNGTPCPGSPASRPFAPQMSAGTVNPSAGTYSPFVFRMTREDSEQELSQVKSTLPPGLVAKLAGIPFCPDAALASISAAEGTGKNELANPACPPASQIGSINAGLGAGPGPNYFQGKVYLAGPYKGTPLSLAIVVPAIAGPFDLGSVVVRTALEVDPETAQVRAISDPFPTILHGVLLRVRDVRLKVDRPQTTINPTSCAPMSVTGQITGVGGSLLSTADDALFDTSNPFQAADCASLAFKPKLSFRLFGGTKRGAHPKLRAVVRMPAGGANIATASVALPRSEFLDQSHIGTVCTRVQFAQDACPAASVYGFAEAKTPLLDETLSGPIYLRSSDNLLPDLVVAFRGGRVDVNLVGRIDSVNQGIRNSFEVVPDAPVSEATFTFHGGKKGLLINSRNLCKKTYRATAKFTAHSGKRLTLRPKMRNSCKKSKRGKQAKRARHSRAR